VGEPDDSEGEKSLGYLTVFIKRLLNDQLPAEVTHFMCDSILLPLRKDATDPLKIRPVALGDSSKLMLYSLIEQIEKFIGRVQAAGYRAHYPAHQLWSLQGGSEHGLPVRGLRERVQ
jgi:hypothetical protein